MSWKFSSRPKRRRWIWAIRNLQGSCSTNVAAEADEPVGIVCASPHVKNEDPRLLWPSLAGGVSLVERRCENCLLGAAGRNCRMHTAESFEPGRPLRAGFAHTMIGQQGDEALLELQPRKSGNDVVYCATCALKP